MVLVSSHFMSTKDAISKVEGEVLTNFVGIKTRQIRRNRATASGIYRNGRIEVVSQMMDPVISLEQAYFSRFVVLGKSLRQISLSIERKELISIAIYIRVAMERIAFLEYLRKSLLDQVPEPEKYDLNKTISQVDEHFGKFKSMNYGMGRNITEFALEGIRGDRAEPVSQATIFRKERFFKNVDDDLDEVDQLSLRATNIMTRIEAMDDKVLGFGNVYDFLCEFVHPNLGDLSSASNVLRSFQTSRNKLEIIEREFSFQNDIQLPHDFQFIFSEIDDVFAEAIVYFFDCHPSIVQRIDEWKEVTAKTIHSFVGQIPGVRKGDDCPCLSGKRVKDCAVGVGRAKFDINQLKSSFEES